MMSSLISNNNNNKKKETQAFHIKKIVHIYLFQVLSLKMRMDDTIKVFFFRQMNEMIQ